MDYFIKKHRNSALLTGSFVLLCVAVFGFFAPSFAGYQEASVTLQGATADAPKPSYMMEASINASLQSGKIYKKRLKNKRALKVFYEGRYFEPYWMSKSGLYRRAETFVQVIAESWTHGLNPYDYHYSEIQDVMNKPGRPDHEALEVLLSDAFIRYAYDMTGMRIHGKLFKLDAKDWKVNYSAHDSLALLGSEKNFDRVLRAIEPQGRTYKAMRREFISVVQEEAEGDDEHVHVHFGGLMKPGWNHKGILSLRKRLGVAIPGRNKYVYDDDLAAAVIRFQRENSLNPDGVIGTNTLRVMNRTNKDKIHQLVANMERLRWAKPNTADRFVIVNVPSATLWAVEDGDVSLEMPVIVGNPARRTVTFSTEIQGVRFNPDWTIPPTIKRVDILPKIQEDPQYLLDKGIELIKGYGRDAVTLDPMAVDWDNISTRELHSIRMVQVPGDHNPLGRFRVLMPNVYNIYLHDTNKPHYFEKTERALSSGCMRMKYPQKMAEWIMRGTDGWSKDKMFATLESMKVTDIRIENPIPVQVVYYTTWMDDDGNIVYGNDVYNYDEKLIAELSKLDAFRIPVHHKDKNSTDAPHARLVSYQ